MASKHEFADFALLLAGNLLLVFLLVGLLLHLVRHSFLENRVLCLNCAICLRLAQLLCLVYRFGTLSGLIMVYLSFVRERCQRGVS